MVWQHSMMTEKIYIYLGIKILIFFYSLSILFIYLIIYLFYLFIDLCIYLLFIHLFIHLLIYLHLGLLFCKSFHLLHVYV